MKTVPNTYVGQSVERIEDPRLLAGRGIYVDDLHPASLLHAAILRSSVAHGRIQTIDTAAAKAMPGVYGVFTAVDIDGDIPNIPIRLAPIPAFNNFVQPVIAAEKVRFVGEPIAFVVAESRAMAEDALEIIGVEIEPLPPVADRYASMNDTSLLFEQNGTNVAVHYEMSKGDPKAAFEAAEYVRRESFSSQRHAASPLETRGLLAEWDAASGRLTVSGATKVTFHNRAILAGMLGLPEDAIEMSEVDVGGGFGVRGEFYPEDFLIPFAARKLGRPVKWIEDRREHFMASNHSRDIGCDLEIACRRDGTILGLRGWIHADMGAYIRTNGGIVPTKAAQFLPGPYRIPNVAVDVTALMTNKTPIGTYRAPGRVEANFFRERLFDMAARDLGIEPLEFRRKNLISQSELPYSLGRLVPYEGEAIFDSGDYHHTLDRCLKEIGWDTKADLNGRLVDGRYHGVAVTCFVQSGGGGPKENARAVVEKDGTVSIFVGSSALGQGIETAFAQIAADALSLPLERFRVLHGSTSFVHEGSGTFHSRSVMFGGWATLDAAQKLMDRIKTAGAERLGIIAGEVSFRDERVTAPDGRSISLQELAASNDAVLEAHGSSGSGHVAWSYGAQAAHVAVDIRTGHVAILDYVVVEDVGRAINPAIIHGQTIGAIVQGLGGLFLEHILYDDEAQLLNASFADYLLPTASDFPQLRSVTLEQHRSPTNPLGAKGGSEGGNVSVAATVTNAIAAALESFGVEPKELPLSPPRLWQLIETARARTADAAKTAV
jgi:carbon-monoxide dehydrogenase large subunit